MAVSFNELMEIKTFLRQQHIIVSEEWIEACVTFIRQELPQTSVQNLKKTVLQQWLVADLEEIACPSLPPELSTAQKITLSGSFALQIQGIKDISRPAYSQLKQLTDSTNANEEFSSAPTAAVPEWEAKPNRMLMLNLTDGCVHIQGMEYRCINVLSPNLPPGIKVLIKGPVECRFGVLLLTVENISILGGEVESKLQQFSRENLLREQLQIEACDSNQENAASSVNDDLQSSNNVTQSRSSNFVSSALRVIPDNRVQQNQINSSTLRQNNIQHFNTSDSRRNTEDLLDHFETDDDDDFEQNIDYGVLDEIENSQKQSNESIFVPEVDDYDIWEEDEDVVRDLMEFQDANSEFKMPFEINDSTSATNDQNSSYKNDVFTYLSTVVDNPSSDCVITIKGFIITVLSKLECTPSKGWSLTVKINDGTATVNADIHDKVLENIIGVSAQTMIKKQVEAAKNMEVRKEVMETISKCKVTLQNYNCLMDVQFGPGKKPCIVKCSPVTKLHIQQLLERVRSRF